MIADSNFVVVTADGVIKFFHIPPLTCDRTEKLNDTITGMASFFGNIYIYTKSSILYIITQNQLLTVTVSIPSIEGILNLGTVFLVYGLNSITIFELPPQGQTTVRKVMEQILIQDNTVEIKGTEYYSSKNYFFAGLSNGELTIWSPDSTKLNFLGKLQISNFVR
jgi:hypothetical protein